MRQKPSHCGFLHCPVPTPSLCPIVGNELPWRCSVFIFSIGGSKRGGSEKKTVSPCLDFMSSHTICWIGAQSCSPDPVHFRLRVLCAMEGTNHPARQRVITKPGEYTASPAQEDTQVRQPHEGSIWSPPHLDFLHIPGERFTSAHS